VAAIVLLLVVCGVGVFAAMGLFGWGTKTVTQTLPTPSAVTTATPAQPAQPAEPPAAPSDAIVTDLEARGVVTKFMDYRLAQDVAGSKTLCTAKMLSGETLTFIDDKYWRPDSYQIIKTTPDLMYIHVAVMGQWPSGDEPLIFQVYREPESGKVLIDGMLDPAEFPELLK
jgi:hypothetical protein